MKIIEFIQKCYSIVVRAEKIRATIAQCTIREIAMASQKLTFKNAQISSGIKNTKQNETIKQSANKILVWFCSVFTGNGFKEFLAYHCITV